MSNIIFKSLPASEPSEKSLEEIVLQNSRIISLLTDTINGIHRVEMQLEKLTEEPLDYDEREL